MRKFWTKAIVAGGAIFALVILYLMFGAGERYHSLTQQEAIRVMDSDESCLILDVRTEAEYAGGHIPGALCLPIDKIRQGENAVKGVLPDKRQTLLIYCYAGRRAADAAQILMSMGYRNAYEFGGIVDWKGEVTEAEAIPEE